MEEERINLFPQFLRRIHAGASPSIYDEFSSPSGSLSLVELSLSSSSLSPPSSSPSGSPRCGAVGSGRQKASPFLSRLAVPDAAREGSGCRRASLSDLASDAADRQPCGVGRPLLLQLRNNKGKKEEHE